MTLGLLKDSSTIVSLLEGLADNWHALGTLLGLSKPDLDQINSVPAAPKVYLNRIVTKWLMRDATSSPTISALLNMLAGIKGTEQIVQSILESTCSLISFFNVLLCIHTQSMESRMPSSSNIRPAKRKDKMYLPSSIQDLMEWLPPQHNPCNLQSPHHQDSLPRALNSHQVDTTTGGILQLKGGVHSSQCLAVVE